MFVKENPDRKKIIIIMEKHVFPTWIPFAIFWVFFIFNLGVICGPLLYMISIYHLYDACGRSAFLRFFHLEEEKNSFVLICYYFGLFSMKLFFRFFEFFFFFLKVINHFYGNDIFFFLYLLVLGDGVSSDFITKY